MIYSEEFKTKVKKAYPNCEELHRKLDSGDAFVGRYLDDSSPTALSLDTVLTETSLEELQQKARAAQEKAELYSEWCELFRNQNPYQ